MSENQTVAPSTDAVGEIDLREFIDAIWKKKFFVAIVSIVAAVASAAYAFTSSPWYTSKSLLGLTSDGQPLSLDRSLSGLAALAGVRESGGHTAEFVATLTSRDLAAGFIEEKKLLPVFFSDMWDAKTEQWTDEVPTLLSGVEYFHDQVFKVTENTQNGLIEIEVHWTEPETTAAWANEIVALANNQLRASALMESDRNIEFLSQELQTTALLPLQESIGRLLETELQKQMLAEGNAEFAFKVIDSARVPVRPSKPRKLLVLVGGTILGSGVALVIVIGGVFLRRY